MNRKAIAVAVIVAAMLFAGVAGSADPPADGSYFMGVWSGTWDMGQRGQDITITIGEKNEKGYHKVTYDYGFVKSSTGGEIPPGSFALYGKVHGRVFYTGWKDRAGAKRTVTLEKYKEDQVKAKLDLEGPSIGGQRPYYNAILKRK
ncbi:MAG: hypothetical protein ACYC24_05105 [Desulfobacteria bacterium]